MRKVDWIFALEQKLLKHRRTPTALNGRPGGVIRIGGESILFSMVCSVPSTTSRCNTEREGMAEGQKERGRIGLRGRGHDMLSFAAMQCSLSRARYLVGGADAKHELNQVLCWTR